MRVKRKIKACIITAKRYKGCLRMLDRCGGLKNFFSIFSSFDLTFNNIWCILDKKITIFKSGRVRDTITQREQRHIKPYRRLLKQSPRTEMQPTTIVCQSLRLTYTFSPRCKQNSALEGYLMRGLRGTKRHSKEHRFFPMILDRK